MVEMTAGAPTIRISPRTRARTHVMHIVPELGVGGLPQVVATLCAMTDRSRFDLSVLCINYVGELGEEIRRGGVPVECVPRREGTNYFSPLDIARTVRSMRPDIVHTHNTQAFVEGSIGARLAGVKRVIHTDHARLFPDKRRYILAERAVSLFAERVVAVSDHTSEDLRKHVRISPSKLLTIPNGIVSSRYQIRVDRSRKRRELGIAADAPVLGIGARLVEQKAHGVLLQAVQQLKERFPDIVLMICGEGHLEAELRRCAADLGIEENVRFAGVRLDMPELLQIFDVYVLPSYWEGLPMALLEAMAAGCPVVASAVGGVPTAIVNGENGTTVAAGSVAELAEGVADLLTDPQKRARYIERGRQRFAERFSAERMTKAYESLYDRRPQE
jgi:glycosyltransferase involved in cell wall biosynthesis